MAFIAKQRVDGVTGEDVVGNVEGRVAIILDDMISTGSTLCRAARACRKRGATEVHAAATHGLFVGGAPELMAEPSLTQLAVTDSVAPFPDVPEGRLVTLGIAPLLAGAVERLHDDRSIVELLEG
jgi:ribose-phosphate pyrophosphokinase